MAERAVIRRMECLNIAALLENGNVLENLKIVDIEFG